VSKACIISMATRYRLYREMQFSSVRTRTPMSSPKIRDNNLKP